MNDRKPKPFTAFVALSGAMVVLVLIAISMEERTEITLTQERTDPKQALKDFWKDTIRSNGYRCDSISDFRGFYFGSGFVVHCNDGRYTYEVEDKGGRVIVTSPSTRGKISMDEPFIWVLIGLAILGLYFIPSMVASERKHPQLLAIFMLNLFLGWSILGWVVALVWACMNQPSAKSEATN